MILRKYVKDIRPVLLPSFWKIPLKYVAQYSAAILTSQTNIPDKFIFFLLLSCTDIDTNIYCVARSIVR